MKYKIKGIEIYLEEEYDPVYDDWSFQTYERPFEKIIKKYQIKEYLNDEYFIVQKIKRVFPKRDTTEE